MRRLMPYLLLCLLATTLPLWPNTSLSTTHAVPFPGWPASLGDRALSPVPLTARERHFTRHFPGKIQRFTDGQREYIIRWVTRSTRKLHPASDCLRGVGYTIKPLAIDAQHHGATWSTFHAINDNETLRVYERIYDDHSNAWTDTSAWYWSALLGNTTGPWWSVTIAEKIE